jgi:iron complex transport system substrate-binding protein
LNNYRLQFKLIPALKRNLPLKSIISLDPAITETLFSLGLEDQIKGRTEYCIHPSDKVEKAIIVGGTKNVNFTTVDALEPDLIIAEKDENTKEIIDTLRRKYPVYVADMRNFEDAFGLIEDLGKITGEETQAAGMISTIRSEFMEIPDFKGVKAVYIIWKDPYMAIGGDTYIDSMLERLGINNVFRGMGRKYPKASIEDMLKADIVFLASEPFAFGSEHKRELEQMLPGKRIILVDGEMFCWYGSHMLRAARYFRELETLINELS